MDAISKFVNVLLIVIGLFFVTTLIAANLEDRVIEESVTTITTKFTDNVRKQGMLTPKMYQSFIDQLDAQNMLFYIEMVYTKEVVTPGENNTAVTSEESFYTDDITASLYSGAADGGADIDGSADGQLLMNKDDTFYVKVTNRSQTLSQKYGTFVPWLAQKDQIIVRSGGLVRDEEWG